MNEVKKDGTIRFSDAGYVTCGKKNKKGHFTIYQEIDLQIPKGYEYVGRDKNGNHLFLPKQ